MGNTQTDFERAYVALYGQEDWDKLQDKVAAYVADQDTLPEATGSGTVNEELKRAQEKLELAKIEWRKADAARVKADGAWVKAYAAWKKATAAREKAYDELRQARLRAEAAGVEL